MNIDILHKLLLKSWCKETAFGESWNLNNPSLNQCAITALVVQDLFGGKIIRCEMTDGDSHYWNRLPNYDEVDLTKDQFEFILPQPLRETAEYRTRQYILSFPKTMKRYGLLLQKLSSIQKAAIEDDNGIELELI